MRRRGIVAVVVAFGLLGLPAQSSANAREDARAIADAARTAVRGARSERPSIRRSDARLGRDVEHCDDVQRDPRNNLVDDNPIDEVFFATLQYAVFDAFSRPLHREMKRFVADLQAVGTHDPVLAAGVRAWTGALAYERLYRPRPSFCAALRRWRASGYAPEQRPAGEETLPPVWRAGRAATRAIRKATRRLMRLGISQHRARAFEHAFPRPLDLRFRGS